jgi:hypothetical protein
MTDNDEKELHRLCDMLKEVDEGLDVGSPLREAVSKGALALSIAFTHGLRSKVENWAECVGRPLTETQRDALSSVDSGPIGS